MSVRKLQCKAGTAKVDLRNLNEHIQRWWQKGAFYENSMLHWIWKRYSGGTFVDAGSCIGNHTLFFVMFCGVERVLSIEPSPYAIEFQKHNLSLNKVLDKVIFEQCALGSQVGRGSMVNVSPWTHFNVGMNQLVLGDDVDVVTLDSLIEKHGLDDVTLLKMDVEWYEPQALAGSEKLLTTQRPVLFIEAPNEAHLKKIEAILGPLGYVRQSKHNPTPTYEFIHEHSLGS